MPTRKWGSEQIVNTSGGFLSGCDVAALVDGTFVAVWQANEQIFGQRFSATGAKLGGEFSVHTAAAGVSQRSPAVSGLGDGGIYVTWLIERSDGHYDATGKILDQNGLERAFMEPTPFGSTAFADEVDAARIGAGVSTATVWIAGDEIRGRIFAQNGAAGPEISVNQSTVGIQEQPAVAATSGGLVAFVWVHPSGDAGIKARIFDTNSVAQTDEFDVGTDTLPKTQPAVAWLNNSHFVVTWEDDNDEAGGSTGSSIRARIFNQDGAPLTGVFLVNSTMAEVQLTPAITALPNGGFVISWEDYSQVGADNSSGAIRLQAFDGAGGKIGGEIVVNTTTTGQQLETSIAALPDGRVVVTWRENFPDDLIRMQIVDPRDGIVTGTGAGETLYGHDLVNDEISGFSGDDLLIGLNGDDGLYGGEGADRLRGGFGADYLDGGGGTDTADYSDSTAAVVVNLTTGISTGGFANGDTYVDVEGVTGSNFADTLTGDGLANVLNGGAGADTMNGGLGRRRSMSSTTAAI